MQPRLGHTQTSREGGVGDEVEHWVLGGQESHTSLVPLADSDVEGYIDSGRGGRKGPVRPVVQREDRAEPPETEPGKPRVTWARLVTRDFIFSPFPCVCPA